MGKIFFKLYPNTNSKNGSIFLFLKIYFWQYTISINRPEILQSCLILYYPQIHLEYRTRKLTTQRLQKYIFRKNGNINEKIYHLF